MLRILLQSSLILTLLINVLSLGTFAADLQADDKQPNTVYKQTNKEGVVEFTDIPNEGTKPIRIPAMNTFKQKPLPATSYSSPSKLSSPATKYSDFIITTPVNDKAVRENSGIVAVNISISPDLHPAHTIKVIIDNDEKLSISGTLLSYKFSNVSRGTHTVQAFIYNAKNNVLMKTPAVTFHLQRFALKPKPAAKPKNNP